MARTLTQLRPGPDTAAAEADLIKCDTGFRTGGRIGAGVELSSGNASSGLTNSDSSVGVGSTGWTGV